jgi:D-alanyl-D-alanine carboxypeptidase
MRTLGVWGSAALVGLCICACGGAGAATRRPAALTLTPARARSLQRRLDEKVAESGVAGASAAIVFPDGSTWKGAAGYADTASRRAMTCATALSFASITKVATAALAMRLVEQGRLALDDPILRWYPAWRGDRTPPCETCWDTRPGSLIPTIRGLRGSSSTRGGS